MRTLSASACALTLLLAGTATFARADDAAVRKSLEKQYAKISEAYKTKNVKPALDVTSQDYTLTLPTGQVVTRKQMEGQFNTSMSFVQSVTNSTATLNKVTVKGNEATVDVQETLKGIVADFQTQGKVHKIDLVDQYHDIWLKTGGNWLRRRSQLLKGTVTMDGQTHDLYASMKKLTDGMKTKQVLGTKK